MRKTELANGEYYHIYNRGVDKRIIFSEEYDIERFILSMTEFNTLEPVGSLYERRFLKNKKLGRETSKSKKTETEPEKLVEIIAYCLNPNHFHLLLRQTSDGGISEFMKRLSGGYTKYYNHKYDRSGVLLQGVFKSIRVDSNEYLLHVSAYINLNNRVHRLDQLGRETSKFVESRSSWQEYMSKTNPPKVNLCMKESVLEQFRNPADYRQFAENSLRGILERRGVVIPVELLVE
jgi:REP element-mobilizing transposase RayT